MSAAEVVAARIRAEGPVPFEDVVEVALYHPEHGFYAARGEAGRRGDFLTSPEVGPLFGAVVARALDAWWRELGRPDPFTVVEGGAGRGALALAVRAARPDCLGSLTWVLVERSAALRARQAEHLPVQALADLPAGPGPRFATVADLGDVPGPVTGVVLANELLDNLAFGLVARRGGAWHQVRVGLAEGGTDPDGGGTALAEVLVPAPGELAAWARATAPDAPDGARLPTQAAASAWVARAQGLLGRGRVVVVDYAVAAGAELAARPWGDWVRTYRAHERGGAPLEDLGGQDVTCEVCLDQLDPGGAPPEVATQAGFLRAHGIEELVEEGRRGWAERAAVGDLAALRARSRVREAEALLDPAGLGAFLVATWSVPPQGDPPSEPA